MTATILLILILAALSAGSFGASPERFRHRLRLPQIAVPKSYKLFLKPDLENSSFSGSVEVKLRIVSPTHYLVMNAAELQIRSETVNYTAKGGSKVLQPVRSWNFPEDEIYVLEFHQKLPKGTGILAIGHFTGLMGNNLTGFYRSKYDVNGNDSYMAVTQFEPTYARQCFPCWDEPALKATFQVTLEVPSHLMAFSNMPILDEKHDGYMKTVSFQETPVMSSYLVAVVIGLFDHVEDQTSNDIIVRVYTPVGKATDGIFGLNVGVHSLEIYQRFFNIAYPLPKLDMVGIPEFDSGAMENFGLITFNSSLLYVTPESANLSKHGAADTIAHELSHQWCGNLVTMEWWTDVWLNEGFASWLSVYAVDQIFPEWDAWTQFATETTSPAFWFDALPNSHPIELKINHTRDIERAFDYAVYMKGPRIVSMLHTYLGSKLFQRSMASYIKTYAWSSATIHDLWKALEISSGKPVGRVMSKWTKQKGFPALTADVSSDNISLKLKQMPFGSGGTSRLWVIPVTVACNSYDAHHQFLLEQPEKLVKLKDLAGCSCTEVACPWIKINVNQTGFYRVRYSANLMTRLQSAATKKLLFKSDEFGILDDLRAFNGTPPASQPKKRSSPRV
uniref:Aminopeptidase n=1 Tax=Kalanchoe fedtschenkoi TaxID=63787 RepID=A0A7N0R8T6_KALFE